jgi:hypothetical protein
MQQYSSEIHGNYNSFSSRNLIMEKDKELECPEGPGGLIKKLKLNISIIHREPSKFITVFHQEILS